MGNYIPSIQAEWKINTIAQHKKIANLWDIPDISVSSDLAWIVGYLAKCLHEYSWSAAKTNFIVSKWNAGFTKETVRRTNESL